MFTGALLVRASLNGRSEVGSRKAEKQALNAHLLAVSDFRLRTSDLNKAG